jgi:nucleotidyltransferase/DNA polymerase involved in DNA repair
MCIACIHIPYFAIEAERQRRPDITARLILIGEATVFDCSPGGDPLGVRRCMRMSEAIALCPRAVVLSPDAPYYQRLFAEVLGLLGELSPDVEPAEAGTAFMSLAGFETEPHAFIEGLIASLHRRLGFMASAGIASGKFAARVSASIARPGIARVIATGEEAAFLAPLRCTHLPASEAMLWRLKMLGIETMGEIARLPLGAFQQQFGLGGKRCWELANGIDNEPLVPRLTENAVVRRMQLPAPTIALETILAGFQRLLFAAYSDRARQGHWVRKVVVRDCRTAAVRGTACRFPRGIGRPESRLVRGQSAITRHPPDRPLEELEIELCGLSGESGKQAPMFESKRQALAASGGSRASLEHERETVDRANCGGGTVVADPRTTSGARRLRQLNQPRPVSVETDDSRTPVAVVLGQRRAVDAVLETWRIEDEWWRARPISRTYWRLLLEDGRTIDVYLDSVRDRWYKQAYSG